jgi:Coenzyme PQQ synthesis protein D (PqqD)
MVLMETGVTLDTICASSDDVVAREIEGEIIIVPLVAGIGDDDDELYTLNESAHAIWRKLDGQRTLRDVAAVLAQEFGAPQAELEADVLGFAAEMARRGIFAVAG